MIEFILCFVIFMLIGLGPSLYMVAFRAPAHRYNALLIAPAFGVGVVAVFITNIVYTFDIAIIDYTLPMLIALLGLSGLLTLAYLPKNHRILRRLIVSRTTLWVMLAIFIVGGLLLLPSAVGGETYRVWQGNSADWLNYNFMAFYRLHFNSATFASPTRFQTAVEVSQGLFTLGRPGVSYVLAWFSSLYRTPVYLVTPYYVLALIMTIFPMGIALGRLLRFRLWYSVALGGVLALGFWAYIVSDINAISQLGSIPVTLLMVYAWINFEQRKSDKFISKERLFLAVSIAFIFILYPESLPLLAVSFGVYYAICWLDSPNTRLLKRAFGHGITLVLVLLIGLPTVTQTIPYIFAQVTVGSDGNLLADWQSLFFSWLYSHDNMLTNLWGVHPYLGFLGSSLIVRGITTLALLAITVTLMTFLVNGFLKALKSPTLRPQATILVSVILAYWGGGVVLHFAELQWTGAKFIAMGAPYVLVALFLFAYDFIQHNRQVVAPTGRIFRWVRLALPVIFVGWILTQWATPLIRTGYIVRDMPIADYPALADPTYADMLPIIDQLNTQQNARLYVTTTHKESPYERIWILMLTEQSGDYFPVNGTSYRPNNRHKTDNLPDFWVFYATSDYLQNSTIGQSIVSNDHFRMYRMSPQELDNANFMLNALAIDPRYQAMVYNMDTLFISEEAGGWVSRWMVDKEAYVRFIASGETPFMLYFEGVPAYDGMMRVTLEDTQAVLGSYPMTQETATSGVACFMPTPASNDLRFEHDGQLTDNGKLFVLHRLLVLPQSNRLDIGTSLVDQPFLMGGWESGEQWGEETVRWANQTATVSSYICPEAQNQTTHLRFRAFYSADLNPEAQVVTITINGTPYPPITLIEGWEEYDLPLVDGALIPNGMQQIILTHDWTSASSTDTRQLSAAYDWFEWVTEAGD